MPYPIVTERNVWWPPTFALADNTLLLFANGLDAVMKWSGVPNSAEKAGMEAPTEAPPVDTHGSSSSGIFRGNYDVYYRFVGKDGQPSNLSPITSVTYSSGSYPAALLYRNSTDGDPMFPWVSDPRIDKIQIWRTTGDQSITVYLDSEHYYPKSTAPTPPTDRPTVSDTTDGPASAGIYKAFVQINAIVRVSWSTDPVVIPWARSAIATSASASLNDPIKYTLPSGGGSGGQFIIYRTKAGGDVYYVDVIGTFTGNLSSVGTISSGNEDDSLTEIGPVSAAAPTVGYSGSGNSIFTGNRKFFYESLDSGDNVLARSSVTSSNKTSLTTQIDYSGIAVGPTGTVKRRIYRTKPGESAYPAPVYYVDVDINDNSTTTATSTAGDASLSTSLTYPDHPGPAPASTLSAPTIGLGGTGGSTTDERFFVYTYVNEAGEESLPSPVRAYTPGSANQLFAYSDIDAGGSGVVARRIYRTKAGEHTPFYLDVVIGNNTDTTAVSATADAALAVEYNIRGDEAPFSSTTTDAVLRDSAEYMPILNADGSVNANRFDEPFALFSVIVGHQERMYMAVPVEYTEGHVEVTNASATVQGRGTNFTDQMVGRYFYVRDHPEYYEVTAVDTANQTLTIQHRDIDVPGYAGPTDIFAEYSVQPPPSYRNSLAWSGRSEPEAFSATKIIKLSDDGDQITGLMPFNGYIYVLKRRHIYRAEFVREPSDGNVPPVISRGCVNQRSWAKAHGLVYLMDFEGIYRFNGEAEEQVSLPIRNLFAEHINWNASKWFHAVDFPPQETVRFFVSLGGDYLPRHALCFNYRHETWWVEEFPWGIGGSALSESPVMRLLYGSEYGRILTPDANLDGVVDGAGRRGKFQAVSLLKGTLAAGTLPGASPGYDGLLHAPIAIVSGPGARQINRIVHVETSGSNVIVRWKHPWKILPTTDSTYQIGSINWTWRTGILWIAPKSDRYGLSLSFEPTDRDNVAHLLVYESHSKKPVESRYDAELPGTGIRAIANDAGIEIDLMKDGENRDQAIGFRQANLMPDGLENSLLTDRFVSLRLMGYGGSDRARLYSLIVEGAA